MQPQSDAERETIAKILRRLRRQTTSVNRQSFTLEQVIEGLRREAYSQEQAGGLGTAALLDAAENVILTLQIKLAERDRWQNDRRAPHSR